MNRTFMEKTIPVSRKTESVPLVLKAAEMKEEQIGTGSTVTSAIALIENGFKVNDILMPHLVAYIELKKGYEETLTDKDVCSALADYGIQQILHCESDAKEYFGKVMFSTRELLKTAAEAINMSEDLCFNLISNSYEMPQRLQGFTIRLKWFRRSGLGICYLSVQNTDDIERLVGSKIKIASCGPLKIKEQSQNKKDLVIRGLDPDVTDEQVRHAIANHLGISVTDMEDRIRVVLPRERVKYHSDELQRVEKIVSTQVSNFIELDKFSVTVKEFTENNVSCRAFITFKDVKDCDTAAKGLLMSGIRVGNKIAKVCVELKATVAIPENKYTKVQADIDEYIAKVNNKCSPTTLMLNKLDYSGFSINISTTSHYKLAKMRLAIDRITEGETIEVECQNDAGIVFSAHGKKELEEVMQTTDTEIYINEATRRVTLHGLKENRRQALRLIGKYVRKIANSSKRIITFQTRMEHIVLRSLFQEYGSDISGLMSITDLYDIVLNLQNCELILFGDEKALATAEQLIDDMKEDSKGFDEQSPDSAEAECPVCLGSVDEYDFIELRGCNHIYCKVCLLGLIHSSVQCQHFPIKCMAKDCGENIFLDDIYVFCEADEISKTDLVQAAVRKFVCDNEQDYSFCISPLCDMIYQVNNVFRCPKCHRKICTHCKSPFHLGVACEMYTRAKLKKK